ncbi:protein-glucosylgalactosylhydroxylysine glucosidase-like, partial [Argonauta hians]
GVLQDVEIILPVNDTVFTTNKMPIDSRKHPTVGNGHIATVVFSDTICMNGFYNGVSLKSHRARIPSVSGIKATISGKHNTSDIYALNVQHGLFSHVSTMDNMGSFIQSIYAHRKLKEILVVEIIIERYPSNKDDITVSLNTTFTPSKDLCDVNTTQHVPTLHNVTYFHATNNNSEEHDAKPKTVHMLSTNVPTELVLPSKEQRKTFYFLTSVGYHKNEVFAAFQKAMEMTKVDNIRAEHACAWLESWKKGYIDIQGNSRLSQMTYAAQYYLLSALPSHYDNGTDFIGLSPAGLAYGLLANDYGGHVFWDQDIWMFPPILMLRADLAKVLMKTRTRTLDAARARAAMNGQRGAMYPWESAQTGMETTNFLPCSYYEIHVTGDIAFAALQYLHMTGDLSFFRDDRGAEMVESIAEFWIHRVELDKTTMKYVMTGVMGPDEYHYPVNNSIYTNYIVVKSLETAIYVMELLEEKKPDKMMVYQIVKDNIVLPFDSKLKYHPEYDGYIQGETVKQADVILLGFPLMMDMPTDVRFNDLLQYADVSDKGGPAMTWSMFSIAWLELGNTLLAETFFEKNFKNVMEPFKLWSEYNDGNGAVNFQTGMGGFLQNLMFGYGGFRIYKDQLEFNPQLPKDCQNMTFNNVDYQGSSFTLSFNHTTMAITLTEEGDNKLVLNLKKSFINITLPVARTLHVPIEIAAIVVDRKPDSTTTAAHTTATNKTGPPMALFNFCLFFSFLSLVFIGFT